MRVIAGRLGGRNFASPHSHRTHPMSDKMRGALFNTLGDIEGLTVLDAFAGSGALSLEALSRGATSALMIDNDASAQVTIAANLKELNLTNRAKLVKAGCSGWSDNNPEQQFDIVLADPPYDALQVVALQKLVRHVGPDGLFVLSWPGQLASPDLSPLAEIERKQYGDAQLIFYR